MRAAVLSVSLFVFSLSANADTAIPSSTRAKASLKGGSGVGGAVWRGRCAERLERAKDEIARTVSMFSQGRVEAVARERGAAGDPTAQSITDVVEFSLYPEEGGAYVATVEPEGDLKLHATVWTEAKEQQWFFNTKMYLYRRSNGLVGTLIATRKVSPPAVAALFEKTFKRAVDDCLAMGKK